MNQEELKQRIIKQGYQTTEISNKVDAHGTRYRLPLEGREIEVVYYGVDAPNKPLVVCMHGGGFLFGGCAFDDLMWDRMRKEWKVNIVSIGYRKTPEFMYPCALYDVHDAIIYLRDQMPELDFNRSQISVFGNSAGGTLAAAVCILAKQRESIEIKYQFLNYPLVDEATSSEDKGTPEDEIFVDNLFNDLYVKPEDRKKSTASPIYSQKEELVGLPEAYIIVCEKDSLRAEGEKYEQLLRESGVKTHLALAKDMCHAYYEYGLGLKDMKLPPHVQKLKNEGSLDREVEATLNFYGQAFA